VATGGGGTPIPPFIRGGNGGAGGTATATAATSTPDSAGNGFATATSTGGAGGEAAETILDPPASVTAAQAAMRPRMQ
jgi:hypothetical protein